MDAHKQTQMVQALDMTPAEIESVVSVVEQSREMAKEAVRDLVTTEDNILDVLHRIGSGQAFSKQPECMCLYTAMGKNMQLSGQDAVCGDVHMRLERKSHVLSVDQ